MSLISINFSSEVFSPKLTEFVLWLFSVAGGNSGALLFLSLLLFEYWLDNSWLWLGWDDFYDGWLDIINFIIYNKVIKVAKIISIAANKAAVHNIIIALFVILAFSSRTFSNSFNASIQVLVITNLQFSSES